ncbi:Putative ribonuclease H protein At1g65750, partial [Linum perenne]
MGFASSYRADARGFKGGVWVVWDPLVVTLTIRDSGDQFIHAEGSLLDGSKYFITAVYASPRPTRRVLLWDVLKQIAVGMTSPWAVVGDFNSILSAEDKQGGTPFSRTRNKSFIDTVELCGLMDLPISGPRFTWSRNGLSVRLDRALVNCFWWSSFPESSVRHLHRIKSDHRPIVLCPFYQVSSSNVKPFRFISAWISHASFNPVVSNSWGAGAELTQNLEVLTARLKKWNKDVFGNIFKRKKRLTDELRLAEDRSIAVPSEVNRAEEERIRAKLELVLWQEEAFWIQKSRSKWIVEGDRNTHFFHMSTLKRRAFNRIKRLKDDSGAWVEDQEDLARLATNHFKNFYSVGAHEAGRLMGFSDNRAAAGGVIRDCRGNFVSSFAINLGSCSIMRAELRGIIEGMNLAWEKGIRKLCIQTDSKAAVDILTCAENHLNRHTSLVQQFQGLKARNWVVQIHHIYREANFAADYMANLGQSLELGAHVFQFPNSSLLYWLRYDLIGV